MNGGPISLSLSVKSGAAAAAVTAVFVVAAPAAVVVGAVSRRPISSPLRPLPLGTEEKKASPLCLRSQFLSPFLSLSLSSQGSQASPYALYELAGDGGGGGGGGRRRERDPRAYPLLPPFLSLFRLLLTA